MLEETQVEQKKSLGKAARREVEAAEHPCSPQLQTGAEVVFPHE